MAEENKNGDKLPDDITEEEKRDYLRSGNLELYELRREGDRIAREKIKLNNELAERHNAEAQKRALRNQLDQQKAELAAMNARLLAPPPPDPYANSRPLNNSTGLPEIVKGVINRLWHQSGEWTDANQQGLVDMLVAMGPAKSQAWAYQMRDALATDTYGSHELSPKAILRGSTGLKQIAGPSLMPDLKAIGGPTDDVKQLSDGRNGTAPRKKKRKKKVRRHEESDEGDDDHEEVIDDSPMGNAESPWGDGGYSH